MSHLINGRELAARIHEHTKQLVEEKKTNGIYPKLGVIVIGNDKASETYVGIKERRARELGIDVELYRYSADVAYETIQAELQRIQTEEHLTGLIVQLPIPETFYPKLINEIDPALDVDCLTYTNLGKIVMHTNDIMPPTPGAVMTILDSLNVDLKGKRVCIVGTGVLVGKPLAIMCMNREATVTTVNKETPDIGVFTHEADIIISGVGQKGLITGGMVKEGAIVIDAGVDFERNVMFGDVDIDSVSPIAAAVTPTPGGVGPLTVAILLRNVALLAS